MAPPKKYWLMKSEPNEFGIADLARVKTEPWDGVRNYQARNFMRDDMKVGDLVLFYHSNAKPPGVAGVARVCREAYPDFTAWDPNDAHFDPKTNREDPTWYMVDVEFVAAFEEVVPLDTLKATPALEGMLVIRRGQRLSIQPLTAPHFRKILKMGGVTLPR